MASKSTFTPKASLTDAPTNLKEAIDWILRVTGRDGKKLGDGECICGLASAVTDLLQSVTLEYHGYQGDTKETDTNKGATETQVKEHLNGLFSLVRGLGGTAVVRTYIDQLAQVLSALVGWSKIDKCSNGGDGKCTGNNGKGNQHGKNECEYLKDIEPKNKCDTCGCMKWNVKDADGDEKGHHLGRGCQRCSEEAKKGCQCSSGTCSAGKCKCALDGKCCKCCCKSCDKCKENAKCSCIKEGKNFGRDEYHKDSYRSAYRCRHISDSYIEGKIIAYRESTWKDLSGKLPSGPDIIGLLDGTPSHRRHQCARILLGSVCLIWSGITYMYWTGKYHKSSPRWNNHILDGTGLDDGTLSQWLQALGFPRDMLNNSGPKNRLDKVIWDGLRDMLYLGFPDTGNGGTAHGHDNEDNTFRNPAGMNYAGYIHTLDRGAFCSKANLFFKNANGSSTTDTNIHKCGALFKLYILSCAYFTGLQQQRKALSNINTTTTPKTIREILYWLSALPYSPAYKGLLQHCNSALEKASPTEKKLSFLQQGRNHPITVHEFNLFAHFQAVTQYCPLVLIGIQGGIHITKGTKEPPIHSLYANTACGFTYPAVDIQAYNQVVHYIRALFYQLYFLRKQCAVKVAMGGKWRECRYGNGVVSKGVISWMCLGCDPMEHDRKGRVKEVGTEILKGVVNKLKALEMKGENTGGINGVKELRGGVEAVKTLLGAIGDVVVQLGNAQERLDTGKSDLGGVMKELKEVFSEVNAGNGFRDVLQKVLEKLEEKVEALEEAADSVKELKEAAPNVKKALTDAKTAVGKQNGNDVDPCKNLVSATIDGIHKALVLLKVGWNKLNAIGCRKHLQDDIANAIKDLISLCNSPKCSACDSHSTKCGRQGEKKTCPTCHQQYMDGTPSPLQAFLEDRLPGFSCEVVRNNDNDTPEYPPAASHLGHCGGSGQCCPLPMGFRGQFQKGSISDMTGSRLYGILYFFSNENMMQSCVYTLVRVTAELSATTPQVLGDVFGFFRGGVGEKERGKNKKGAENIECKHEGDPSDNSEPNKKNYFCGWCASGLRDEVQKIEWIPNGTEVGGKYRESVGKALINIKGDKDASPVPAGTTPSNLSTLTKDSEYLSPLTGELYTAVSATFGGTYLSWVLYLSDALEGGLRSLSDAFKQIECRGCKGNCDPNKCKKGAHGDNGGGQCGCQSIVSCTGVLPVLYRHGFSYGNPFNLEGYHQKDEKSGDYSIENTKNPRLCHQFLESLSAVINKKEEDDASKDHPLTNLLSQVGKLQYDIRLPWIFVLTLAWLVAVLYLAFGAIWPLDWTHMRSHWLRGGEHQWQCMWYKVMTGRKGMELVEYFGRR